MTGLSGGQAARVGLATLLLSRYDVLLLDEPTNDLDLAGLDQLERFVAGSRAGIVVVSHDREFLSRTVTRVVELDLAQQLVRVTDGGYDAYLAEREVARRHAREEYEEYADTPRRPRGPGAHAAQLDGQGRPRLDQEVEGRRQAHQGGQPGVVGEAGRQGAADRPADRAPRGRRGAAQGVGAADGDRRRAARRRRRGHPARRGGAPRGVHARAGGPAGRLGGPAGDHRRERLGQVDAAGRAARPGAARRGDGGARPGGADRRDRPGPRPLPRRRAAAGRLRRARCPTGRRRRCARCWRSSG